MDNPNEKTVINNTTLFADMNSIIIPLDEYRRLLKIEAEFENMIRMVNMTDLSQYYPAYEFILKQYKVITHKDKEEESE